MIDLFKGPRACKLGSQKERKKKKKEEEEEKKEVTLRRQ